MKKNLIMKTLVVAGMMGLMLTGCGKEAPEKVTVEVEPTVEATTEVVNPEEQPLIDEEPTVTPAEPITETATDDTVEVEIVEDGTVVSDEQVEVGDILSELGLTVTPCGTMDIEITTGNGDETRIANATFSIETVPSDEEGYVDTTYTYTINDAKAFLCSNKVYDRYTGVNLQLSDEFDKDLIDVDGELNGTAVVTVDGKEYAVSVTETAEYPADKSIMTLTVHHPENYDGLVFARMNANTAQIEVQDDATRDNKKLGEEPVILEGAHFFTATNN